MANDRLGRGLGEWAEVIVEGLVLVGIVVITLLDQLDVVTVSEHFLARAAIYIAAALALVLMVNRSVSRLRDLRTHRELQAIAGSVQLVGDQLATFRQNAEAQEVMPSEIAGYLSHFLATAEHWRFRGGSGRWQRQAVLPHLAKVTRFDVHYKMQILDPRDSELCARYAAYRARQLPAEVRRADEGEARTLLTDILACIYAAGWYRQHSRIRPSIFLLKLYSPLRYDIGGAGLMATVADPTARGLYARRDTWYYTSFVDEFDQACSELPRLVLPVDAG